MTWFPRLLGFATAAYGVAVLARPRMLVDPCGLTGYVDEPSSSVSVLCRGIGARDVISGLSMMFAPSRDTLRLAVITRSAADIGDALVLDLLVHDPQHRGRAATVAAAWGALCAVSGLTVPSAKSSEPASGVSDEPVDCGSRRCRSRSTRRHARSNVL